MSELKERCKYCTPKMTIRNYEDAIDIAKDWLRDMLEGEGE